MKTFVYLILTLLIVAPVSGQVLLEPHVTGIAGYLYFIPHQGSAHSSSIYYDGYIRNGGRVFSNSYFRSISVEHGIMEFNIQETTMGRTFPLPEMTTYNWFAQLVGLIVDDVSNPGPLTVKLYDLHDAQENGQITAADANAEFGDPISLIYTETPSTGAKLTPVNVTEQLRRDLFGVGNNNLTSGLILKTESEPVPRVSYNQQTIRLEVFINTTPTSLPTDTPSPTPTASHTPTPTPSPSNTSTPTTVPSNTPTPTGTGTSMPTETPTSSPTPDYPFAVNLWMPSTYFTPGSLTSCFAYIKNDTPETVEDLPVVIVLEVEGCYFFAPDFNDFSFYLLDLPPGETRLQVVKPFSWPESTGHADGICWYAAVMDAEMSAVSSRIDDFCFGWGE